MCHHCSAFGHLRPHYSKFHSLKRKKKKKEKLGLLGCYAKKGKPVLSENNMLKKVFNALNLLFMRISGSHSSNPRLSSHETPILNNFSVGMRKGSYG